MAGTAYDPNSEADSLLTSFKPSATAPPPPTKYDPNAEADSLLAPSPTPGAANPPAPAAVADTGPQPDSWAEDIKQAIFPTKEEKDGGVINPKLHKYPDWIDAPEIRGSLTPDAIMTLLGTAAPQGPDDIKNIVKKQFPNAKVERPNAPNGKPGSYVTMQFEPDGPTYAYKPGLQKSDFFRAMMGAPVAGAGVAMAGALPLLGVGAGLSGVIGAMLASRLSGSVRQRAGGSEPSLVEDMGAGVVHSAIGMGTRAAGGLWNFITGSAPEVAASTEQQAQKALGSIGVGAARGDAGDQARWAAANQPNPEAVAAANALPTPNGQGVLPSLHPAYVSDNPTFQQVSQAIPPVAGTLPAPTVAAQGLGSSFETMLDKAGAEANAGNVDREVKPLIKGVIDKAKKLTSDLYAEVWGKDGVGGLVPAKTETPVPSFDKYMSDAEAAAGGKLPDELAKIRDALYQGSEKTPTQYTVEGVRRKLSAASAKNPTGPYASILDRHQAGALNAALDADQMAKAATMGGDIPGKALAAKAAAKASADAERLAVSTLGKSGAASLGKKSIAGQVNSAVRALATSTSENFDKLMSITPDELRQKVAQSSLYQFIKDNGELDIKGFVGWYKNLEKNKASFNALTGHLGDEMKTNLGNMYKVASSVQDAIKKASPGLDFASTFSDEASPAQFAKKLLLLGSANVARKGVAHLTGIELPGEMFNYLLAEKFIFGAKTPAKEAVMDMLSGPMGRAGMEQFGKGPVSDGFLRNFINSSAVKRVTNALQVPAGEAEMFWRKLFTTGAVGSPLRASMAQPRTQEAQ